MPVEIHKKRRPQLLVAIARALEGVWVEHKMYVDVATLGRFDDAEAVLSPGERAELRKYIGDRPLSLFAHGHLAESLEPRGFENGCSEQLVDVVGLHALPQLAESMVAALERLPYDYIFSFALSSPMDSALVHGGPWRVGRSIEITKGDHFHAAYPIHREGVPGDDRFFVNVARILNAPLPKIGQAHVSLRLPGYMQRFARVGPSQEAADQQIRSFFGLAMVFSVVRYQAPYGQAEPVDVYVHIPSGSGPAVPHLKFQLTTSTSRALQGLQFLNFDLGGGQAADWPSRHGPDVGWVEWVLEHPKGERLVRAARWYFDSFGSDSILMQYLQAMICLEILLGDEPGQGRELSVGAALKNRCAYLIGQDLTERDQIMSNLSRIYTVRSSIVHNGLSQLSTEDRELLPILRWYCARVIALEAARLGAIVPPPPPADVQPSLANAVGASAGED